MKDSGIRDPTRLVTYLILQHVSRHTYIVVQHTTIRLSVKQFKVSKTCYQNHKFSSKKKVLITVLINT